MKNTLDSLNAQTWVRHEDFYSIRLEVSHISLQGAYDNSHIRHYTYILEVEFTIDSSGYITGEKEIDGITYRFIFT